jgi:hypothetical protein
MVTVPLVVAVRVPLVMARMRTLLLKRGLPERMKSPTARSSVGGQFRMVMVVLPAATSAWTSMASPNW